MESQYLKDRRARLLGLKEPEKKKAFKRISKMSEKKKNQHTKEKTLAVLDKAFYAEHWTMCPHECQVCKKKLGREPLSIFFHHALPKRLYPEFRHTHENIIVLCPDHHTQAEADIECVPYVKKRTIEIRKLLIKK